VYDGQRRGRPAVERPTLSTMRAQYLGDGLCGGQRVEGVHDHRVRE
jgi:hypothetical protein